MDPRFDLSLVFKEFIGSIHEKLKLFFVRVVQNRIFTAETPRTHLCAEALRCAGAEK
jgi:hypothetical protein